LSKHSAAIYDQMDGELQFLYFEEDMSEFDGIYINMAYDDPVKVDKEYLLGKKVFTEAGQLIPRVIPKSEWQELIKEFDFDVILIGFVP
jgi:hypothetical protein